MANPTTAKPTGVIAEWDSTAATVGASAQCMIPLLGSGAARDVVGNVLGYSYVGINGTGIWHPPTPTAGLFTAGGLSDPATRFMNGSPAIRFPSRGILFSATPHTMWAVFRPFSPGGITSNGSVERRVAVFGTDSTTGHRAVGYSVAAATGVITLTDIWDGLTPASTGITLTSGKWYLAAITWTGGTGRLAQVYNFTDQAYVTPQSTGTAYTGSNVTFGALDAVINGFTAGNFDLYACGMNTVTFDPATTTWFADLVADPCRIARGTYAGGGALTAGGITLWDTTKTSVTVNTNRPSGGTPASYQYRLHRSLTPDFTPDTTTRIGSLQASPILADATAAVKTTYYYKVEQTDGTSTVYSTTAGTNYPQVAARLSRGDYRFLLIGDSRGVWGVTMAQALRAHGFYSGCIDCHVGSTSVYSGVASGSWQPNTTQDATNGQASTTLLQFALAEAAQSGITELVLDLGINDAANNSASTWLTKLGYLLTAAFASGITRVTFTGPFIDNQYLGTVASYIAALDTIVNGTTKIRLTKEIEAVQYGFDAFTYDNLHIIPIQQLPGYANALEMANTLDPQASGGGGGSHFNIGGGCTF